ncbi:MAG TPA: DUF5666 domain-containing protein [Stellaceae bacterium]|nr:DUF5666 domain-containing protein [Stellaceae bacterium]
MRSTALIAFGAALVLASAFAEAQAPAGGPPPGPPQGTRTTVRGTVEKLDGNTLMVKSRDGTDVKVTLTDKSAVRTLTKKTLADIKEGDYVASTGRPGPDGKLHAVEVRIFPEALRGVGEGQNPWDLTPDSKMTNATVTGIVAMGKGATFKVKYKGTESEFIVDPETPIQAFGPGDRDLLKPNVYVVVLGLKQEDGTIIGGNVTAEANGVKPEM